MWWDILLQHLPLVILLILAIFICGADLIKAYKVWKEKRDESIQKKVKKIQDERALTETLKNFEEKLNNMDKKLDNQDTRFNKIEERLDVLTESDMNDIKSWIVDKYHKFYVEQKRIDAFSADTIERRFSDYKKEGGNSYIEQLVKRLRSLPMDPPSSEN